MASQIQELAQPVQEFILKPITIPNVLLLSPGKWNDVDYTELEIQKAFNSTDWNDRKYTSLYLDHQDTKERGVGNWVGYIKNRVLLGASLYGDLEIWNPMIGAYLQQAKAKFGVSATLAGRENKRLGRMEDFHFESFSIVTDPACKPAMINLADKTVNLVEGQNIQVVTMENETKEDLTELESVKHRERREDAIKDNLDNPKADLGTNEKTAANDSEFAKERKEHPTFTDEQVSQIVKDHKNLGNEGSVSTVHALEPVGYDKKKEELDAKFERQVQHIKDSLKKSHPEWSEDKIKSVAYATANKMKEMSKDMPELAELFSENPSLVGAVVLTEKSDSDAPSRKENSDNEIQLKGGNKMPEMENESVKVAELEAKPAVVEAKAEIKEELKAKEEPKSEDKKSDKKEDKDEEKEELSNDAILNKVKEMSAEELVKYSNFVKAYLSEHKEASAKEVTLAYEKSAVGKKELSAADLLASLDARTASLKELDSKNIAKLETEVKELQAKVKTPDRKTLSVAYSNASPDANLGMLSFLQHRIN